MKTPGSFLDTDQQTTQLRRCIHDATLPLDVRVAGALILLFGVPVPRITNLTTENITNIAADGDTTAATTAATEQQNTRLCLTLGGTPIQLPPALADLSGQLLDQRRDPSAVSHAIGHVTGPTPYLLPGMIAGQPSSPSALTRKLRRHGIIAFAARNSARRALAEQLPASVLADLLDIHISTAINWARQTKTDWTSYVAER